LFVEVVNVDVDLRKIALGECHRIKAFDLKNEQSNETEALHI